MGEGSDGETGNGAVRRSFGRRKAAAAPAMKKKKVPQRGMGMEKLERQRIQQEWNKIKEFNHQTLPDPMNMNLQMININPAPPFNHHYNLGGFYPQLDFPNPDLKQFGVINNHSISIEFSSNPNSVNCDSQHCNACHKKKKLNSRNLGSEQICKVGECRFLGMNFGDNQNNIIISKEENQGLVGNGNKGGEIVGIHRKGSSMVMEYDFFPSSNKTKVDDDDDDDDDELVMMPSSPISPNWQLDLSLKLSN